jgi:hypothetical protein
LKGFNIKAFSIMHLFAILSKMTLRINDVRAGTFY